MNPNGVKMVLPPQKGKLYSCDDRWASQPMGCLFHIINDFLWCYRWRKQRKLMPPNRLSSRWELVLWLVVICQSLLRWCYSA